MDNSSKHSSHYQQFTTMDLPIFKVEDELKTLTHRYFLKILKFRHLRDKLQNNDCLVFIGETGCGKSTQIPKIIYNNKINENGMIAITQPRRLSTISIANRVAEEMNCKIGKLVGYSVRFKNLTSKHTKIKYLTDGMLLKEAINDRYLLSYNCVILDEVHERTLNTDILMGILKKAQNARNQSAKYSKLKVILMSAAMPLQPFVDFFDNVSVVPIEGRNYRIECKNLSDRNDDYMTICIRTLFQVNRQLPMDYGVLMFLTGQEEIETAASLIRLCLKESPNLGPMIVHTLYASLSDERQMSIFKNPKNKRKVVISTNVAETSITIPGIRVVIDCGRAKIREYDPVTGFESLRVQKISKVQVKQREGRAGRESDGYCYRIYTNNELMRLEDSVNPEILRSNLSNVILQLIDLGVNPRTFDYFEKPDMSLIENGLEELRLLGAIEESKDNQDIQLSTFGKQIALFPLNPKYGRILLKSITLKCSDEIISLIALLSTQAIFIIPEKSRVNALTAHLQFNVNNSDHLTLLNAFQAFMAIDESKRKDWCRVNFLNLRNLNYALDVRKQLVEIFKENHFEIVSCDNNHKVIRKCLLTGLFTQVAEKSKNQSYLTMKGRHIKVYIHPSSIVIKRFPKYLIFTEVVETERCFIHLLSEIEYDWIHEIKTI